MSNMDYKDSLCRVLDYSSCRTKVVRECRVVDKEKIDKRWKDKMTNEEVLRKLPEKNHVDKYRKKTKDKEKIAKRWKDKMTREEVLRKLQEKNHVNKYGKKTKDKEKIAKRWKDKMTNEEVLWKLQEKNHVNYRKKKRELDRTYQERGRLSHMLLEEKFFGNRGRDKRRNRRWTSRMITSSRVPLSFEPLVS
ncbi:microtubule-associated protein 9-like [Penaeus vannamei]|uniref:microtubule-associated protein 9-like n=1 Tax=Penaeus vannamei TaxID=6689 RepID=UPI00387F4396